MKLDLAAMALAPLLIVQGRRVRQQAIRLPEAVGPRIDAAGAPVSGAGRILRLLIVGDSSAAGVGATTQDEALAGRLALALLGRGREQPIDRVEWHLDARTGSTASDALVRIRQRPPARCDAAVVVVGVNDITGGTHLSTWLQTIDRLVSGIREHHGATRVALSGLPPMHRFPLLPQPLRWYLGARAREFDDALARRSMHDPARVHLPIGFINDPQAIASDGFHPSPAGYAVWAAALARVLEP
jgi:lysophospholipase L1-like esterase